MFLQQAPLELASLLNHLGFEFIVRHAERCWRFELPSRRVKLSPGGSG